MSDFSGIESGRDPTQENEGTAHQVTFLVPREEVSDLIRECQQDYVAWKEFPSETSVVPVRVTWTHTPADYLKNRLSRYEVKDTSI